MFTNTKALTIPDGDVVKIECNGVVLWEKPSSEAKNWVLYSTEADGKTIYNGGLGYKEKYRVRSGGEEATSDGGICTGYIPFKKGDTLYMIPAFYGKNTNNAINFYDSEFTCLGQFTASGATYGICNSGDKTTYLNALIKFDNVTSFTLTDAHNSSDNIAYIRVTNDLSKANNNGFIITINEEIA